MAPRLYGPQNWRPPQDDGALPLPPAVVTPLHPPRRLSNAEAAKQIAKDAMRGEEGDPLAGYNDFDRMFFANARVGVFIPITDPIETRRVLVFLIDQLPGLVAQMDRITDKRSKALLAMTTLKAWSQAFKRGIKGLRK